MEFINWQLSSMSILFITGVIWGLLFDLHNYIKKKSGVGRVKKAGGLRDFFFWVCSFFLIPPRSSLQLARTPAICLFSIEWGSLLITVVPSIVGVGVWV